MKNIRLILEYDGTQYLGWQRQPQGPTIQEVLEETLKKIIGEEIRVTGSGRTDSGVHALGQVANFKTDSRLTPEEFQKSLNSLLPKDIVVKESSQVDLDFHSQFSARSKVYIYKILNRPYPSALERNRCWFMPFLLNLPAMREASLTLLGEHDFRSFVLSDRNVKTTVRRVLGVVLDKKSEGMVEFEIEATGFLKAMVRSIVGTLVEVGRGKITPEDFKAILGSKNRTRAGPTAPARGLFLKEVKY